MQPITKEMLADLYTTRDNGDGTTRNVYNDVYLRATPGTTEHALYELSSDIAQALGVTFNFSYEIMPLAASVLAESEVWNGDELDDITEQVDSIVPVYNHDLLKIANAGDYHHIDEAREVYGNDIDTLQACSIAWHNLIDMAVRELHDSIASWNNNNA